MSDIPGIKTIINPGSQIVTTIDPAPVQVNTTVIQAPEIITTHNTVPQVVSIVQQDKTVLTTTIEGNWDVVWSVNGQNGDVLIDVVISDFIANTTFTKNACITYDQKIYRALRDFTTGATFDPTDWQEISSSGLIQSIQRNGVTLPIVDKTVDIIVPTKTSDIANDSFFQNATQVTTIAQSEAVSTVSTHNASNLAHSDIRTELGEKASSSDLTALSNRVTTTEGDITSLGARTTTNENDINTIEGKISNQASTSNKLTDKGYVDNADSVLGDRIDTAEGDIDAIEDDVSVIEAKIPNQATSSNQLADKNFVNSSINSVTAYYITKNAIGDQFGTKAELLAATTFYSGGEVRVPTRNDYCIVLADESKTDPITSENPTTRYIYQNSQWEFQYVVNKTTMTAAQLAAVNSGITSGGVSKLNGIEAGAEANVQTDWNQNDQSSDSYLKNKPANLVQDASYVHTDNNFTNTLKTKLNGIAAGAEVNVQTDWNQTSASADDYLKNKPDNFAYIGDPTTPEPITPWIDNTDVKPTAFAMPVYIGRMNFTNRTYNNANLYLSGKTDLYAATGVSTTIDDNTNLKFTLPTTGQYVVWARASLWVGSNTWDYMVLGIDKGTSAFCRAMGYKGGNWGFVNTEGFTTIANNDYIKAYLNTAGNTFSDGNIGSTDSNLMVIVYKVG